ncbi:MAG TPA: hypothetical protein GXZ82_04045, partial [Firmicutes bacterium]|nr:hypothetical protein [Bacillota bacterium]
MVGLTVSAQTLETGSGDKTDKESLHTAEAHSGAGSDKVGVAGSLAVNLTENYALAQVGPDAYINSPAGDVNITSGVTAKQTAKATPVKDAVSGNTAGVGASVAVNVALGGTATDLSEGVYVTAKDLQLAATQTSTTETTAEAGASGGTAVTPVVAITVADQKSGVSIGNLSLLDIAAADILAKQTNSVTTLAAGDSKGTNVAVGAATALAFVNDQAVAMLAGSVEAAGDVKVAVEQTSRSETTATASTQGGEKKSAQTPEDGVDKKVQDQTAFAQDKTQEAQKAEEGRPAAELKASPSAQTDEGKVSVAAAISVNSLDTTAQAYTAPGAAITAAGKLTVETQASRVAAAQADASMVKAGQTGVGVAVAVNTVDAVNTAYLDKGEYQAQGVTVQAGMQPNAFNVGSALATSGAGAKEVGVAGALAVQLVNTTTTANIGEAALIDAGGGDVVVTAESRSGQATRAAPAVESGKETTVGVGASVAVFTLTDSVTAEVGAGTELDGLRHLQITANSRNSSETEAEAGAQGDVVVDSVVAVANINQTTQAVLNGGAALSTSGNAHLLANDVGYHNVTATGDTSSSNVGVGSSVALLVTSGVIQAAASRDIAAGGGLSVLAQAERYYDAQAVAGAKGAADFSGEDKESTSSKALQDNADAQQGAPEDGKVLAAAAVAMNILNDDVRAFYSGNAASGGDIRVKAVGTANFSTYADASTADFDNETGISNAVALSVFRNDTTAQLAAGSTVTGAENLEVKTETQTNTNPSYLHKLAAEAVSGSGAKKAGVAGAYAVTWSQANNTAFIGEYAVLAGAKNVVITSDNTARSAAKAWGGSAAKVGVGASVAVIVSDNTYQAYLGDDAYADVGSLTIKAGNNNIDTPVPFAYERFADLDLQVLLSSSNYYTEALAGTATEQTAVSGSFVINFLNDTIEAYIGEYAQIESSGPVRVQAVWDATVRAVSGGMTAGFKVGVGTAFTNIVNSTSVLSALKTYAAVYEASSVGITAAAHTQIGAFAASAAATGSTAVTGVSSLIVSNNRVEARADEYARLYAPLSPMIPGETRSGSVFITAENMYKSWNIAGDAAGGGDAGVGGAHATNLISNTTLAVIDRGTEVGAFHGIDAAAVSQQDMTTIAAGGVGAGSVGVAGSTVENVIDTTTHAWVAEGVHMNPQWSSLPQIVHPEQYVRIQAADATEMINVAGGAAFGGKTGVGMGLDVTVIDKNTQAFIFSTGDPPTYVNVYHTLEVAAKASQNVTSVVGGLGGGGTVGVSGVNAVYTVTNLTRSYIGAMAQVNSRRNVLVTADDENDLRLIVGNAAFGPSAGVGAAGAIVVVDKITEAYIDAVASVTALGKGTGVMAHTGLYDVSYSPLGSGSGHIGRPDYNVHNLTGDTLAAGDDAVDNPSMTQERSATPQQREVQGIAVTAVTKDQIESIAVGGTAAGGVAVSAAATVTVVTNTTRAFIDEGAWINGDNADAAPEQTVFVAAGSDFYHLGIAGTLAGAATAGVGPGADISVVRNNTEAFIGAWSMVNAAGDIAVEAYAHEDILSIPAAAAGGGSAGVAGGASINVIGNATQAYIADAAYVIADGNVGIRADDTTEIDVIAGSLGIGGGAGVGQALDVTVIEKETSAFVGERAVVEARGVNG